MGCATGCAKTLLIGVNVIFFLAGAAILGGSLYVRFEPNIQTYAKAVGVDIITEQLFLAAYVLMAFGALTLVIGFCGCYGAIKESKCALGIYITFIVLIIGAEIGGGVLVYATKDAIIDELSTPAVAYLQRKYKNDKDSDADVAWNLIMKEFSCCGLNGAADFENSTYGMVPDLCCKEGVDSPVCQAASKSGIKSDVFNSGCLNALNKFLNENSVLLLGIAGGVAGFELLVMLMAICVCCGIDSDK